MKAVQKSSEIILCKIFQKFKKKIFVIQVRIVLFALFVTVYGDISHLYDPPRASEVNLIHQLDVDDRPVPIVQEPHAFQAPAVVRFFSIDFLLI